MSEDPKVFIEPRQVRALIATPGQKTVLVDVRTEEEFSASHIEGSINIPADRLASEIGRFDKDTAVVTVCNLGGARSCGAAGELRALGYEKVAPLRGGIRGWAAGQDDARRESDKSDSTGSSRSVPGAASVIILLIAAVSAYFAIPFAGKEIATAYAADSSVPWTEAQTVKPADLAREIAGSTGTARPVIVCSGFRFLYNGGHIPGAVFHGPASKPEGLEDLRKWAQGVPRSANVVLYCGCCPFNECPNVRPAFEALRSMGFQHLRVLVLPNNFAKDWAGQGYPVEKGN